MGIQYSHRIARRDTQSDTQAQGYVYTYRKDTGIKSGTYNETK